MIPQKITAMEILLEKMNRVFRNFKLGNKIEKIDLDLMKEYNRQFYELILEYESGNEMTVFFEKKIESFQENVVEKKIVEEEKDVKQELKFEKIELNKTPIINPISVNTAEIKEVTTFKKTDHTTPPKGIKKPLSADEPDDEDAPHFGLHHKLAKDKKRIGDQIKMKPVVDLNSSIDLNDKFHFIKELFHGDHGAYDLNIKKLNNSISLVEAKSLIQNEMANKYAWNQNDESVEKFLEAVSQKFQ